MASGGGQGGPGAAARRDKAVGGRRAREAGGTRRRFSGRPRPAVPTAPSASFHTSPPPAPSVRSREYPRRPDRTCSFLTAPSLPSGRPPHRSPEDPLRSPGPSSARVPTAGHSGGGAPSPGARRVGPGAWAARGSYDPGAMRTSGHLARTPARWRGSRSRGSQTQRGRRRGREAWGAGRGAVSRDREKEGSQEEACRAVERRGSGLAGRAGGDRTQRHKAEGVAVRWAGWPRETTKWTEVGRVAPPPQPRADPGQSYLFKRRPPPAPPPSRGLTRRVVSEPPVAGEGSISPRPRPSRPHRGRERRGQPRAKSERSSRPLDSPQGLGATTVKGTAATVAPAVRTADPAAAGAPPRVGRAPQAPPPGSPASPPTPKPRTRSPVPVGIALFPGAGARWGGGSSLRPRRVLENA